MIFPQALPYGSNRGHKIADFVFLPYIYFILAFRALQCIMRYWETLYEVIFPQALPYGSNGGHKIVNFVFLSDIYFILAVRALQCIKRYWETFCEESR